LFTRVNRWNAVGAKQQGLCPSESLDPGLLVHTDDDSAGRRVEVQPDDVGERLFESGIPAELENLDPMRLIWTAA